MQRGGMQEHSTWEASLLAGLERWACEGGQNRRKRPALYRGVRYNQILTALLCTPPPTPSHTNAPLSAPTSLVPSPHISTCRPTCRIVLTTTSFCSGVTRAYTCRCVCVWVGGGVGGGGAGGWASEWIGLPRDDMHSSRVPSSCHLRTLQAAAEAHPQQVAADLRCRPHLRQWDVRFCRPALLQRQHAVACGSGCKREARCEAAAVAGW